MPPPCCVARECTTLTNNRYCTHCLKTVDPKSFEVSINPTSCVDKSGTACWTQYVDSEVMVPLCSSLSGSATPVDNCYSSITVGLTAAPLAYTNREQLSPAPSCPTGVQNITSVSYLRQQ